MFTSQIPAHKTEARQTGRTHMQGNQGNMGEDRTHGTKQEPGGRMIMTISVLQIYRKGVCDMYRKRELYV